MFKTKNIIMRLKFLTILLFTFSLLNSIHSQTKIKNYEGHWEGEFKHKNVLNFSVSINDLGNKNYNFSLYNNDFKFDKKVTSLKNNFIEFNIDQNISFTGILEKDTTTINGFISSGFYFYHIKLVKNKQQLYTGNWNIFMLDELLSKSIFLSIENIKEKKFDAYPFFGDKRFAGTACWNSQKKGNTITFQDMRTGLHFKGKLLKNSIHLDLLVANKVVTSVKLKKSKNDWVFGDYSNNNKTKHTKLNDDWENVKLKSQLSLPKLENNIISKKLANTHSVLIAKKGKIIYEKYFDGFSATTPHDQRSASKSISSAITGIAIDKQLLKSDTENLYKFISKEYQYTKDSLKAAIQLKDLLTMSSGIDAVDFGTKRKSKASEPTYQNSPNWLKTVLEAPMINSPGTVANYGSANPYLLGVILNKVTPMPLQLYMDQQLFKPLEISNYTIQKEITGKPYFGGGMYITPRDMLKFGQLYLYNGKLNGKRILSKKWIKKSYNNYRPLINTEDKNGYGYLWWHKTYMVKGKHIKSIEARGNGGQYIFVIPKLKIVCVITAGNYRSKKTQQPEYILEKFILPTILSK